MKGFTVWDKIIVKGPLTVQQFIDEITKVHKVTVSIISAGKISLYNKYSNDPKMKERYTIFLLNNNAKLIIFLKKTKNFKDWEKMSSP